MKTIAILLIALTLTACGGGGDAYNSGEDQPAWQARSTMPAGTQ